MELPACKVPGQILTTLQESYFTYSGDQEPLVDHDVLWRAGLGADGSETFMPRTVVYDLKGGFGSLRKINALYEVEDKGSDQALWWVFLYFARQIRCSSLTQRCVRHQPVVVQKQEPIPQSAYQQSLDAGLEPPELTTSTVRYWSDFNRVFFHPRSIIQLNDYELNSSLVPFEKWATGQDLFSTLDKEHDLVDRDLRPFIEEADHMQGIQLMATLDDAWGGFASDYIERLRDEYGKTSIWVWGLQDSFHGIPRVSPKSHGSGGRLTNAIQDKRLVRLANKAKSLTELYKNASIIVPITLPRLLGSHVALDPSSHWHTSAVVAAALESATLPSRLKDRENRDTLGGMADLLNTMGNQSIANLQMSIDPQTTQDSPDVRMREAVSGEDAESEGLHLDLDFSPSDQLESRRPLNGFRKPRIFSQLVTRRGQGVDDDANEDEAAEDERFRRRNPNKPTNRRYVSLKPGDVKSPWRLSPC